MQIADGAGALTGDEERIIWGCLVGIAESALFVFLPATTFGDRFDFIELFPFFIVVY